MLYYIVVYCNIFYAILFYAQGLGVLGILGLISALRFRGLGFRACVFVSQLGVW